MKLSFLISINEVGKGHEANEFVWHKWASKTKWDQEIEKKNGTWHFNEMHMYWEPLSISLIQFMWQHEHTAQQTAKQVPMIAWQLRHSHGKRTK